MHFATEFWLSRLCFQRALGSIYLIALLIAANQFIPLLGALNWLIIPLAVIGAAIGMVSRGTAGRNLNLFVILVAVLRLILGHGIF